MEGKALIEAAVQTVGDQAAFDALYVRTLADFEGMSGSLRVLEAAPEPGDSSEFAKLNSALRLRLQQWQDDKELLAGRTLTHAQLVTVARGLAEKGASS